MITGKMIPYKAINEVMHVPYVGMRIDELYKACNRIEVYIRKVEKKTIMH